MSADHSETDSFNLPARAATRVGALVTGLFMTVWVTIWIGFLAFAGASMLPSAKLAVRSADFPQTVGRIERCKVHLNGPSGDSETTFKLDLEYAYEVNGRSYRGTSYDTNVASNNDRGWHDRLAEELRPGTTVPVYYDPADPAVAVLVPGITGGHLFVALFALPFLAVATLVVGGLATAAIDTVRPRQDMIEEGGLKRWDTGGRWPLVTGLGAAVAVMGAVGFGGVFLVAFTAGFRPPVWYPATLLLAGAGVAGWSAAKTYRRRVSGADDLVVDPSSRVLALPINEGRTTRVAVPFDAVAGVDVHRERASKGRWQTTPVLRLTPEFAAAEGLDPVQNLTHSYHRRELPARVRRMTDWLEREITAS